jgi:glycosyl transferase family 25
MEDIDHVVFINLDKRTDRLETIQKELLRAFPYDKITRFSAIYHPTPYAGCNMSHTGVLELAKTNNWKNVLIVEDDMEWCNFTKENYEIFCKLVKNPYDVIMLGGAFIDYNSETYKLKSATTAHCYLVSNHYYDKLIENLNIGLQNLLNNDSNRENANDQYWKLLQKKDNWYIVVPCIATQHSGFSDNGQQVTEPSLLIGNVINNSKKGFTQKPGPKRFRFVKQS